MDQHFCNGVHYRGGYSLFSRHCYADLYYTVRVLYNGFFCGASVAGAGNRDLTFLQGRDCDINRYYGRWCVEQQQYRGSFAECGNGSGSGGSNGGIGRDGYYQLCTANRLYGNGNDNG
jgi:hypothetical protein